MWYGMSWIAQRINERVKQWSYSISFLFTAEPACVDTSGSSGIYSCFRESDGSIVSEPACYAKI